MPATYVEHHVGGDKRGWYDALVDLAAPRVPERTVHMHAKRIDGTVVDDRQTLKETIFGKFSVGFIPHL